MLREAPRLLGYRGFLAAGLAAAAALFTVIGLVFAESLSLHARGVSAIGIASVLGCVFAGNALASVAAGRLRRPSGPRIVLIAGLVIVALGLGAILGHDHADPVALGWRLAVVGLGAGLVIATATALAMQSVAGPLVPAAGTIHNAIRQLGGALSTAILGGVTLNALVAVVFALIALTAVASIALLRRPSA